MGIRPSEIAAFADFTGRLFPFGRKRLCSHLAPCGGRELPATFLPREMAALARLSHGAHARTFLLYACAYSGCPVQSCANYTTTPRIASYTISHTPPAHASSFFCSVSSFFSYVTI